MNDVWARWLLHRRPPSPELEVFRDNVLDRARLREGDSVVDVGCGDGLIAFGALERVGPTGRVVFTDISAELLDHCRAQAPQGVRCEFVQTGLPDLAALPSGAFDAATLRSVLIYVNEKAESFHSLYRVLRPGGRLAMFEPINSFGGPGPDNIFMGCDVTGLEEPAAKVMALFTSVAGPMLDFDERDLLRLAQAAGFTDITLDYRAEVGAEPNHLNWDVPPNPLAPSLAEAFEQVLTAAESTALRERLQGPRTKRFATAYLSARRPH
ncbi:methyltransferase domain-containing protein [Allorhizocola rhizosphaerae]|uniref:methyltransferase domain-containing protein n=1 Tax=Allorhizocola rhizosphaerae TaxID=1872709 RepID=UPI0013C366DB|nr:methyltransferase domain-containing protein [Allorhizocola rhizosphaerae]